MKQSTNKLNEAIERMTTGYKINHAKDNAANYGISTIMTTKIGAYMVAEDNVAMGMDMLTTASESMTQMENLGKRLQALNTQARNGTYGKQSLNAIQAEANSIIDEINRLYSTAKYNGISLFNQKEYDLPDYLPQADPVTGFIENPYDYTEEQIAEMISISKVDSFETGKTYSISSAKELKRFADIVNDGNTGEGSTFVLTEDIDLSEYSSGEGWTPIGNYGVDTSLQFKGTFNGNGHIISNLSIDRPTANNQGLFGFTKGQIKNVGVVNAKINAYKNIGALAGYVSYGYTLNCYSTGIVRGQEEVGGLIGESSVINNSYSTCDVIGKTRVGGLTGRADYTITNCYSLGNVSGETYVGGLTGVVYYSISNSYSKSNVEGSNFVGGLLGLANYKTGSIVNNNISFYGKVSGNDEYSTGTMVGGYCNTVDGINFSSSTFNNSYALQQEMKFIGGCYKNESPNFILIQDYDLSSEIANIKEMQERKIITNLQVGTKGDENSQIDFDTNFEYALGRIKRDGIQSEKALNVITEFLNTMSDKQTQLGAAQNRLESAMDEILTQHDNLISARSTLRDADMAELSSQYIQQQILQEASSTLMATANQSPAIALQLL